MLYRRIPQCRVCSSEHGAVIDRDLVARLPYSKIVVKRGALFTDPEKPLTKACLFNHWKHMKEAVEEIVATEIASIRALPAVLDPANPPMSPARQIIFQDMVEEQLDEIAEIKKLADSGIKDLSLLEKTRDTRVVDGILIEDDDSTLTRNKVRRDTAAVLETSAKVKSLATEANEDLQRLEKGRIVFRMFEIMKNALHAVPEGLRPLVATQLKEGLRADDELRDLLRTHKTAGRVPLEPVSDDD